jgi:limonene-1,2-epoxide hydrolase
VTPSPQKIARLWIEAFNRQDVRALVDLYAARAVHTSPKLKAARPETQGRIWGKTALSAWWEDAFRRMPGLRYKLIRITATKERAFIEYVRHVPFEDPLAVAEVFVVRNGKITESAVYHG